jgi:hypothetical protein
VGSLAGFGGEVHGATDSLQKKSFLIGAPLFIIKGYEELETAA